MRTWRLALQLAQLLQSFAPKRSLEIGTDYGGTLFLLCSVSPPDSKIISVDLPQGPFGGGYPGRKIPLFRKFRRSSQELHLIRGDSHSPETKKRVLTILGDRLLDYLFVDGDHTYGGVELDFEMYSPLVRSGGIVVFHDEPVGESSLPVAVTRAPMHTACLGVLCVV